MVNNDNKNEPNNNNWINIQEKNDISDDSIGSLKWSKNAMKQSLELYEKINNCNDDYIVSKLKEAIHCLEGAYRLYGSDLVIGSFNGGKDAVVILHLLRAVHAKYYHTSKNKNPPKVIYFENELEFPQIRDFVVNTVHEYDLHMLAFDPKFSFVDGLKLIVDNNNEKMEQQQQLAFVLGTRHDDPNAGSQGKFAPSSEWMPPFMRVNPIIDWTYGQVWHFLRLFELPYSDLYDNGYTSLGNINDTMPNPMLLKPAGDYFPAYMLTDWSKERAGRLSKKKQPKVTSKTISAASSAVSTYFPSSEGDNQSNAVISTTSISSSTLASLEEDINKQNNINDPPLLEIPTTTPTSKQSNTSSSMQTVGLLVIGNEIIKGQISDCNTYAAATALRSTPNLKLSRVVIVADVLDDIVNEIKTLLDTVDIIITSGGIGPTHDDITIESVSIALGQPLKIHSEMMKLLQSKLSSCNNSITTATAATTANETPPTTTTETLSEAQMKMATLPENCELRFVGENQNWPILQCQNIYILPGVPQFFKQKISSIASFLSKTCSVGGSPNATTITGTTANANNMENKPCFCCYKVLLTIEEHHIVTPLNQVVKRHPNVNFGSYPFYADEDWKTIVTLESNSESMLSKEDDASSSSSLMEDTTKFTRDEMEMHLKLALNDFLMEIPDGSVLRVENDDNLIIT